MTSETKKYLYRLFNMILKWSLVYMIVLFFLEDVKPFLVSTVFMPHWILFILLISLAGVLWLAPFGHDKINIQKNVSVKFTRIDIWLFRLSVFVLLFLWLPRVWNIFGFVGVLVIFIFAIASEKFMILLLKKY